MSDIDERISFSGTVDDATQGFSVCWFNKVDKVELTHPDGRKLVLSKEEAEGISWMISKRLVMEPRG